MARRSWRLAAFVRVLFGLAAGACGRPEPPLPDAPPRYIRPDWLFADAPSPRDAGAPVLQPTGRPPGCAKSSEETAADTSVLYVLLQSDRGNVLAAASGGQVGVASDPPSERAYRPAWAQPVCFEALVKADATRLRVECWWSGYLPTNPKVSGWKSHTNAEEPFVCTLRPFSADSVRADGTTEVFVHLDKDTRTELLATFGVSVLHYPREEAMAAFTERAARDWQARPGLLARAVFKAATDPACTSLCMSERLKLAPPLRAYLTPRLPFIVAEDRRDILRARLGTGESKATRLSARFLDDPSPRATLPGEGQATSWSRALATYYAADLRSGEVKEGDLEQVVSWMVGEDATWMENALRPPENLHPRQPEWQKDNLEDILRKWPKDRRAPERPPR
jgi:hypothetical protein